MVVLARAAASPTCQAPAFDTRIRQKTPRSQSRRTSRRRRERNNIRHRRRKRRKARRETGRRQERPPRQEQGQRGPHGDKRKTQAVHSPARLSASGRPVRMAAGRPLATPQICANDDKHREGEPLLSFLTCPIDPPHLDKYGCSECSNSCVQYRRWHGVIAYP